MTTIMMKLKNSMMEIALSLSISLSLVCDYPHTFLTLSLLCSLFWEMTTIMMKLKKNMMEITLSLSI